MNRGKLEEGIGPTVTLPDESRRGDFRAQERSWRKLAITLIDRASCPRTRKLSRNRLQKGLRFSKPRDECMAQIVEAAGHVRGLACALPGKFPAVHRLSGNNFVSAELAVIPGEAVLLVRKDIVSSRTNR
jgi:hypothetical protein